MHIVHIIASTGDTAEEARDEAEQGISHFGNGDVWDWYEVGGRWDGHIGATYGKTSEDFVPGTNQLCYAENPELFNTTISNAITAKNAEILETLQALRGATISANEVPEHFLGIPIQDKKAVAGRVSQQNAEYKDAWDELLSCNTAEDVERATDGRPSTASLIHYKLYKMAKLLSDYYDFDSRFYDANAGTSRRRYVDERKGAEPDKQWITVFDLHN